MSAIWPILGMGAGLYAMRLAGMALRDVAVPPAMERALGFVPVAVLTALIVSSLGVRTDGGAIRVVAAVGAAFIAYRTRRMWACILGGMALYWLLRLV